ncbi:MAG: hypothetical protein V1837_04535 [Candidatus Woesearchaeota archaeon]
MEGPKESTSPMQVLEQKLKGMLQDFRPEKFVNFADRHPTVLEIYKLKNNAKDVADSFTSLSGYVPKEILDLEKLLAAQNYVASGLWSLGYMPPPVSKSLPDTE